MASLTDYGPAMEIQWCPGCGNFGILTAMRRALVALGLEPHQVLMVSGIGQAGKFPHYLHSHVFNGLHGRTLPVATAAKIANHELTVIAVGGDGDGYGEGGNHFINAMTRNVNFTYMVHNNQVYALTKGQASPTSDPGFVTKTTPEGAWAPLRPLALAVACDCSFVARSFSADIDHLANIIQLGIQHKGFAFIEVLQPCVSFNHVNTYEWYQKRVYKLEKDYDPTNRVAAFSKALEWGERIPLGVVYRNDRPVYEEQLGALRTSPLVKQGLDPQQFEELLEELTVQPLKPHR
ncbi:MAG: thiamine pyrophosphate-dependent enzyme [Dehalococcoidia bacterium]|nr:thiamine pyrophosphate-dependent enzyme [Dehalococcoidia bacterium]